MSAMAGVLAGRYELEKIIGEGGMATVWRATDSRLDRPVAVKILAEQISNDPEFRARFLQEARAAASFSHPNVVDVLDYGEEDGIPYMVMELVDGEDLKTRLKREGRLEAGEVARIGTGVARGLAVAHRRGLIHRDIKPANILIDGEGTPKVTDFGIVRALGTATQTKAGTTLGSVHYLSPEQVQGTTVDARSDLYSLGVVLYEASTGERPFDNDAPAAIAVRRLSEMPRPPHAVEPSVPQWLSAVIERAMQRDPERRYRTASELENDLATHHAPRDVAAALEGTAPITLPATRRDTRLAPAHAQPAPAAEPRRRRSAAPFLAALVAAAGLIGVGLFFLLGAASPGIAVPRVVGLERDQARAQVLAAGLRPEFLGPDKDPAPIGTVFRQDPNPGKLLGPNETVTMWISAGPGDVIVPALAGLTADAAKKSLQDAGLKLGTTSDRPDELVRAGVVLASEPGAGTRVPPGFAVNLVLSSGPRPTPTPTSPPPSTPAPTLPLPTVPVPTPTR
jgi:serine/threonine-protein kinase